MITLESIDFKSLIAKETNGRMRVRLMALSHIKDGANNTQTARNLHISRRIVNDWVKRFHAYADNSGLNYTVCINTLYR